MTYADLVREVARLLSAHASTEAVADSMHVRLWWDVAMQHALLGLPLPPDDPVVAAEMYADAKTDVGVLIEDARAHLAGARPGAAVAPFARAANDA